MTAPKTKPKSHSREIHIVIPRPDATPDQLRQLAAAKELVGRFLRDVDDDDEASLSMAGHFAHEFLWKHCGGAEAKWAEFPVADYFLETVPYAGVMPPQLCRKLMTETCMFFRWLGETGAMTFDEATSLITRAESLRDEMEHLAAEHFRPIAEWAKAWDAPMNREERRMAEAVSRRQKGKRTMLN